MFGMTGFVIDAARDTVTGTYTFEYLCATGVYRLTGLTPERMHKLVSELHDAGWDETSWETVLKRWTTREGN